jgi:hypothetical protein
MNNLKCNRMFLSKDWNINPTVSIGRRTALKESRIDVKEVTVSLVFSLLLFNVRSNVYSEKM